MSGCFDPLSHLLRRRPLGISFRRQICETSGPDLHFHNVPHCRIYRCTRQSLQGKVPYLLFNFKMYISPYQFQFYICFTKCHFNAIRNQKLEKEEDFGACRCGLVSKMGAAPFGLKEGGPRPSPRLKTWLETNYMSVDLGLNKSRPWVHVPLFS